VVRDLDPQLLGALLAMAGGSFVYIAASDLIPNPTQPAACRRALRWSHGILTAVLAGMATHSTNLPEQLKTRDFNARRGENLFHRDMQDIQDKPISPFGFLNLKALDFGFHPVHPVYPCKFCFKVLPDPV